MLLNMHFIVKYSNRLWEGKETFVGNLKVLYLVDDCEVRGNLASSSNSVISYLVRHSFFMPLDLEVSLK